MSYQLGLVSWKLSVVLSLLVTGHWSLVTGHFQLTSVYRYVLLGSQAVRSRVLLFFFQLDPLLVFDATTNPGWKKGTGTREKIRVFSPSRMASDLALVLRALAL